MRKSFVTTINRKKFACIFGAVIVGLGFVGFNLWTMAGKSIKITKVDESGTQLSAKEDASKTSQLNANKFSRNVYVSFGEQLEIGDIIIRPLNKREVSSVWFNDHYVIFDVVIEAKVENKRVRFDAIQGITQDNHIVRVTEGLMSHEESWSIQGKPLWEIMKDRLNTGDRTKGFVAFRLENNIKEVELISQEFGWHKVIIML